VRDASRDAARSDPSRADRARIDRLRGRLVAVTADTIERLRDTGHLNTPPAEPVAAVTVVCEACDASHPLDSFLERGGCDCDR
jgi:hypothetical protein